MRALGRVVCVTRSGRLIVKADYAPPMGSRVYDDRLALIGEVYDVMGPVVSPYVSVKPLSTTIRLESLVGRMVYVKPPPRKYGRRGKKWKK